MLDTVKELLAHQYEASLSMLNLAVNRCPDASWNEGVAKWKFCHAAFHVVFFADVYLQAGDDVEALKRQPFHVEHEADFRDYEELEDRPCSDRNSAVTRTPPPATKRVGANAMQYD